MATRRAEAIWQGDLFNGAGQVKLGGGTYEGDYSFKSRFQEPTHTSPEELLGAAHAGCYSMALAGMLQQAGYTPVQIQTRARVRIEPDGQQGFQISSVQLETEARVPGLDEITFQQWAETARQGCAVSRALMNGTAQISLKAMLLNGGVA
ncbi:MAG TPA: OsmC family peroxiredoxin [Anaerolineae bacterium]|nr:OsmC family peroxiredoxin [Anaerolineae bacterium]HMR67296.1 OsmC family peroxiredoxin [Anaerolineae bacterium]